MSVDKKVLKNGCKSLEETLRTPRSETYEQWARRMKQSIETFLAMAKPLYEEEQ